MLSTRQKAWVNEQSTSFDVYAYNTKPVANLINVLWSQITTVESYWLENLLQYDYKSKYGKSIYKIGPLV